MFRAPDQLLAWLSERGAGAWDDLKAAHSWLYGADQGPARKPGWMVYLLSTLGHLEMDWGSGTWAATTPCLVNLPSAGATAALVGARPASLVRRLRAEAGDEADLDILLTEHVPADGPTVFYIQYGSDADLLALADRIGARFEQYAAEWMAGMLPALGDYLRTARRAPEPPRGFDLTRLSPAVLRWEPSADARADGLYRLRAFGLDRYWLRSGPATLDVDRDFGVWAALAAAGQNVIRYRVQEVNGEMLVPPMARLPAIQGRTAVLCSGRPPSPTPDRLSIRYVNVPLPIAKRIAASLDQALAVEAGRPRA